MKTPLQAANDLLHVMTEVGQPDCYLDDMRLIIVELNKQEALKAIDSTILSNSTTEKQTIAREIISFIEGQGKIDMGPRSEPLYEITDADLAEIKAKYNVKD